MTPVRVPVGIHVPGRSPLHRLPAGVKLLGLLVVSLAALILVRQPIPALILLAASVLTLWSVGPPLRQLARPLLIVAVTTAVLGAVTWWQRDLAQATVVVARLSAVVLLAWAVSLSTPVSAMLSALVRGLRPLRWTGVRPELVALTLALAIRSVPLLVDTVITANQARQARGRPRSVVALGVPVVVRSVRIAEDLGDALVARGYDPRADDQSSRTSA